MKAFNRRDFLRTSGAAAVFAATPGLAYSQVVGGGGSCTDYRALVCVPDEATREARVRV